MMTMFADIIVDISLGQLDKTFQYSIPNALIDKVSVGSFVKVPFGNGGRTLEGFVLSISDEPKIELSRIKPVISVEEDKVRAETELIRLAYFIKVHYGSTMNQALKTVLPIRKKVKPKENKIVKLSVEPDIARGELSEMGTRKRHSIAKERLLAALIEEGEIPWDILTSKLDIPTSAIRDLEKKCLLNVRSEKTYRNPVVHSKNAERPELNEYQQKAVNRFISDYAEGLRNTYLLYGITGSGKTEVYMSMIEKVLALGKDIIVLIPEIALTYQTLMRFYGRFGDQVSVIHSRLSDGERFDQFERAKNGDVKIMVGPRSALFTPFQNLGLIIIDEEQETAYKSETVPKYHAREVAEERCRLSDASLVLGSATPSLEAFERAREGKYIRLDLPERVEDRHLPKTHIVDMREELKAGNRTMISDALMDALTDRLQKNEQSMLFLNRRGLMGFISCRSCGTVIKCPHCDVSLSLHRDGKLHCHYCGYMTENVKVCPKCGSKYIGTMRAGTEKLEEFLKEKFPQAAVLRMDADTTSGKEGHEKILSQFANREADILLGTQMIVKGHDFSGVTLMGIIVADMSLNASDYRAGERTFDLLTQAAGRAGRGEREGDVYIQTYQPENFVIQASAAQDYEAFFKEEIAYRKIMHYPPMSHLLLIQCMCENHERLEEKTKLIYHLIKEKNPKINILKPVDASISKINDTYRMAIYIKDDSYERLITAKDIVSDALLNMSALKGITIFFDFDPVNGY